MDELTFYRDNLFLLFISFDEFDETGIYVLGLIESCVKLVGGLVILC